jgi:hypothetical protein
LFVLGEAQSASDKKANNQESEESSAGSFPFVVLPEFEVNGQSVLRQSSLEISVFCPLVSSLQLNEYEAFTTEETSWIAESYKVAMMSAGDASIEEQDEHEDAESEHDSDAPRSQEDLEHGDERHHSETGLQLINSSIIDISHSVYSRDFSIGSRTQVNPSRGPFLPWWHQTPPPRTTVQNETGTTFADHINLDLLSSLPTVSGLYTALVQDPSRYVLSSFMEAKTEFTLMEEIMDCHEDMFLPHVFLLHPVFHALYNSDKESHSNTTSDKPSLAGVLFVTLQWNKFVKDLLPKGLRDIMLVIRNTCGESASFLLNGPEVRDHASLRNEWNRPCFRTIHR